MALRTVKQIRRGRGRRRGLIRFAVRCRPRHPPHPRLTGCLIRLMRAQDRFRPRRLRQAEGQAIWGRIPISPLAVVTDSQPVTKLGSDPEWPEGAHSTAAMLAPMLFRSSRRCHSPCAQHHFSANAGRRQGAWDGLNRQRLLESSCEL